jgi:phage/plasmid-associated DNA primase
VDDEQAGLFDGPPEDISAPAEVPLPSASRYLTMGERVFTENEHLVIHDKDCTELGLRALADILADADMPMDHRGLVELEAKVVRQGRIIYTRDSLWVYDLDCKVWVKIQANVLESRIAGYWQVQYGKPKVTQKVVMVEDPDTKEMVERVTDVKTYKRLHMSAAILASAAKMAKIKVGRPDFFDNAPVGLNFQDGLMLVDKDRRWQFYSQDRQHHRQRYIYPFSSPPTQYLLAPVDDPRWQQVCPVLHKILTTSLPGQLDDWRAIRMRFGLALAGLSQHVRGAHLWFVGPQGCGKSSIAAAFGALFPDQTRTTVHLHDASEYMTAPLERSRINVVEECNKIRTPDFFKAALTCGEHGRIEVREVGSPAMSVNLKMLAIMCSNNRPEMPSKDVQAITSRFTIVQFQKFQGPADTTIGRQMQEQARGLIEWSLAGFCDWLQTGGLVESKQSELLKRSWWRSSDNVLLWAASELLNEPGGFVPVHQPTLKSGAFQHYLGWCEASNISPRQRKSLQDFRKALDDLGLVIVRKGKHNVSHIQGVRLKTPRPDLD